jgi:hypothetical protein
VSVLSNLVSLLATVLRCSSLEQSLIQSQPCGYGKAIRSLTPPLELALCPSNRRTTKAPDELRSFNASPRVRDLLDHDTFLSRAERDFACLNVANSNITFAYSFGPFGLLSTPIALIRAPGLYALGLLLPMVYGGIHLTAWNYAFPTSTESLLWKIACLDIALTFVLLVVVGLVSIILVFLENKFSVPHILTAWIFTGLLLVSLVAYACSRTFIVVESFASLRHVPIGIYWTPEWLQMIPHF